MDFKFVSKNKLGGFAALFLVVLLSQSSFFNFFIDTLLGRSFLILFLLLIAYTNKFLGVAVVLFIIMLFNGSDIGYLEGFEEGSDKKSDKKSEEKKDKVEEPDVKQPSTTAVEGFDIVSTERYIQKGKQSNQIPVNDTMRITSDISPYEIGFLTPY